MSKTLNKAPPQNPRIKLKTFVVGFKVLVVVKRLYNVTNNLLSFKYYPITKNQVARKWKFDFISMLGRNRDAPFLILEIQHCWLYRNFQVKEYFEISRNTSIRLACVTRKLKVGAQFI
jgi:hypothetical protein